VPRCLDTSSALVRKRHGTRDFQTSQGGYTGGPVSLLECVPNVSEGRRPELVGRFAEQLGSVPGARLLDHSRDSDHNRSVFTLAGEPTALREALLRLYDAALETIDLRRHRGVHPRVGAVDVVPFVPLAGAAMADAVTAAHALGAEVAGRFALPVYYYEEAALDPARRRLADLRRGGFEGFAARIATPEWRPDAGPARLHPSAGVTLIGARFFLVAFNILLRGADLAAARRVARRVRESSGGLPAVRAIGVWLASRVQAQVSLNLLDYRRTSLETAFSRVRAEAQAEGAEVAASEIVGLLPAAAVPGRPRDLLLDLRPEQVLENRL
jgi:glutamate formiminotransferase